MTKGIYEDLTRDDLVYLLDAEGEEKVRLFQHAAKIKESYAGNLVYYRGLIEFSNLCEKNCMYCGIRSGNKRIGRYNLTDTEIIESASFAYENKYGSIVLQSGERTGKHFIMRIDNILKEISQLSNGTLRVTLSCGEQTKETYRRWYESGAQRYLLRIETSNPTLYARLHPRDDNHLYHKRLECLNILKDLGYQTGSGVMIGLPFQTLDDLANDLLFLKKIDIDMVGMGPYLEHGHTPLYRYRNILYDKDMRFQISLKMIALLRILMKDINIAATTAMQTIDPMGREKAIMAGANVIMPNVTPGNYREFYTLYNNKPCVTENYTDCNGCMDARIALINNEVAYGMWGDSMHFRKRRNDLLRQYE